MRPIDADAIESKLGKSLRKLASRPDLLASLCYVGDMVADAPNLDVPQGEWINCRGGDATCSRCGIRQKAVYDDDNEQHFCGHCGARMEHN